MRATPLLLSLSVLMAVSPVRGIGQDSVPVPPPAEVDTAAMVALVLEDFPVLTDPETSNGPVVEVQTVFFCHGHPECPKHPESSELLLAYAAEHGLSLVAGVADPLPCRWNQEAHSLVRGRRLAVGPPRYHPENGWSMMVRTTCSASPGRGFAFGLMYRFEYVDEEWRLAGRPVMFIT